MSVGCGPEVELFDQGSPAGFGSDGGLGFGPDGGTDESPHRLGQLLFFDKELSGNRDTSCATCHVPFLQTVETLPLSIGQGGEGLGPTRRLSIGAIQPRNTTDLFNRASPEVEALFWDGRVERLADGTLSAPVPLPAGIETLLEAQALLPMLDRSEMRGHPGDVTFTGTENELATIDDEDPEAVWAAIMRRLMGMEGYRSAFGDAFPEVAFGEHSITHAAKALAAFQEVLWEHRDSRFDEDTDLSEDELRGRDLFFGDAGCWRCHGGELLTDQRYHNIGVPQLGPGKDPATGLDPGRFLVTGRAEDRFAFRTPALRNVRLTGPYMHIGAFDTLEAAVRHHLDPEASLRDYRGDGLSDNLRSTVRGEAETVSAILATLDPETTPTRALSNGEVRDLIAFLGSLDSQRELRKGPSHGVPDEVPSGLPVDRWPGGAHPVR